MATAWYFAYASNMNRTQMRSRAGEIFEEHAIAAQAFIASKVEKGLRPAPHYLKTILEGAAEHNLPPDYIESIQASAEAG